MRLKQIIFLIPLIGMTGIFSACSDKDGDWPPMKWKTEVKMTKEGGVHSINVPKEGGSYTFTCTNYDGIRLTGAEEVKDGIPVYYYPGQTKDDTSSKVDNNRIVASWADVNVTGKTLVVNIQPNNSLAERTFNCEVQNGDAFDRFRFKQTAK